VAAVKSMVTVLPVAGLKTRPVLPERVLQVELLVLPSTLSVWVRVAQSDGGGSLSLTWSIATLLPRSTWTHCGNALLGLSQ
jgi:hypothetical protein